MLSPDREEASPKTSEYKEKALQLRSAGFSYTQIAKALDTTPERVGAMLSRHLSNLRSSNHETARDLRDIAHLRHETMIARLWLKAMPQDGSASMDYGALDRIARLIAQDAKLMGYEAPQKHQIDMSVMQQQVGIVVEAITRVLPDDAIPRVYEAVEEVVQQIERKRALTMATRD